MIEENLPADYTPKDREEAAIPIPDYLLDLLRARRNRYPNTQFIFEMEDGKTDICSALSNASLSALD